VALDDLSFDYLIRDLYGAVKAQLAHEMHPNAEDDPLTGVRLAEATQEIVDVMTTRIGGDGRVIARLRYAIHEHERIRHGLGEEADRPNWQMQQTGDAYLTAERLAIYLYGWRRKQDMS
jgi:hypothetical protein